MARAFKPLPTSALPTMDRIPGIRYDKNCTTIEGVVSPESQGGWEGSAGKYDVHYFVFADWRVSGKPLAGYPLTLLRPVPPFEKAKAQGRNVFTELPAYSVQKLSVLISASRSRAVIDKVLPVGTPDAVLLELEKRLREPVIVSTKKFGDLVMNPSIGWFEAKVKWNRKDIDVHFHTGNNKSVTAALKTAEALWSDQAGWKRKIDEFAVKELLPLKNESWLQEGEVELTPPKFKARMKLKSITVQENGRFEFWHDDGDLFWGHSIQICGSLKKGPQTADIPG